MHAKCKMNAICKKYFWFFMILKDQNVILNDARCNYETLNEIKKKKLMQILDLGF
jgi:uncharacterized protein with ATP-grasp and redox domains